MPRRQIAFGRMPTRFGSVANYRKQEGLVSQVIDFLIHDFRILPRKGNFATEPACEPGHCMREQLQLLPTEVPRQGRHARNVAARLPQAGHEPIPHGINVTRHDNGDCLRHIVREAGIDS